MGSHDRVSSNYTTWKPKTNFKLVIRMIDTTTLYHVTAMLWYHVLKYHLLLKKLQLFHWCNKLPWKKESLKKTHYILALVAHNFYLKNGLNDPNSLLHKSDQHARTKLSATFKKILQSRFRATLNLALNMPHRIAVWYVPYHCRWMKKCCSVSPSNNKVPWKCWNWFEPPYLAISYCMFIVTIIPNVFSY